MKEWSLSILLALVAVFAPIHNVIITVGVLIFADLATGVFAAYKRGEPITSAGLRRSVTKLLAYQVAVLTGFLFEVHLLHGILPVAKLVAAAIGAVEMKSLLENVTQITGVSFKEIIKKFGSDNDRSV